MKIIDKIKHFFRKKSLRRQAKDVVIQSITKTMEFGFKLIYESETENLEENFKIYKEYTRDIIKILFCDLMKKHKVYSDFLTHTSRLCYINDIKTKFNLIIKYLDDILQSYIY